MSESFPYVLPLFAVVLIEREELQSLFINGLIHHFNAQGTLSYFGEEAIAYLGRQWWLSLRLLGCSWASQGSQAKSRAAAFFR